MLPRRNAKSDEFTRRFEALADKYFEEKHLNVLVMGPDLTRRSPAARLRRRILALCNAKNLGVKPEHREILRAAKGKMKSGYDLAHAERLMAECSDLIIIIPASAGSIAELGYFALEPDFCGKMIILFDKRYRLVRKSYIYCGPRKAAVNSRAIVEYVDFCQLDPVLNIVRRHISRAAVSKVGNKMQQGARAL